MNLITLTYVSVARKGLPSAEVEVIHRTAQTLNSLDGITGVLLFNGEAFLQVIEGAETAIDALVERLKRDPRHHSMQVTDRRPIERRFFSHWSMHWIHLGPMFEEGVKAVKSELDPLVDVPMQKNLRFSLKYLFGRGGARG